MCVALEKLLWHVRASTLISFPLSPIGHWGGPERERERETNGGRKPSLGNDPLSSLTLMFPYLFNRGKGSCWFRDRSENNVFSISAQRHRKSRIKRKNIAVLRVITTVSSSSSLEVSPPVRVPVHTLGILYSFNNLPITGCAISIRNSFKVSTTRKR